MTKALLYGISEANSVRLFTEEVFKENFDSFNYEKVTNYEYSSILGKWLKHDVLLIGRTKVFSLFFEDGSVWDTNNTWRDYNQKDWIVEIYNKKLQEA